MPFDRINFVPFTLVLSGISMYVMYYYYYYCYHNHNHFILTVSTVAILIVAAPLLVLF